MKMKRLIFRMVGMLGLLALFVVPAVPVAADSSVSIGVVSAQVAPGSDFVVKVNVGSVTDFDAAQYDVTYNSAVIQVTSVTAGLVGTTAIPVESWGYIPASTQGKIRVINNVPGIPGVTGSGYLAEIHFHVVGAAGTGSDISLSGGILGDKNAHQIPATWAGGSVNVTAAVTADFSANVTEVQVNQGLTFTASATGGSGVYATYAWNFGDGGTSNATNPNHSYATTGNYTVSLTVTDSLGTTDTKTRTSYITVYAALTAGCSADFTEALVNQSITFTASSTGGKPGYTYAWDFGDSGTSTAANPTHSFAASGNYTVSLTVTDALGNTSSTTILVKVYKLGDANKDGIVDVVDITYVEHIIMGDSGYVSSSWVDANQDGDINALDITAIELIILRP